MRLFLAVMLLAAGAASASAQSLHLGHGERAVEAGAAWSVGPSSKGLELTAGFSLDGRTDIGVMFARYTYTFDDGFESTFGEYAPYLRVFLVKEQNGAPVSLSLNAQLFVDDYESDDDSGKYVQVGTTVYKQLKLNERFALIPFAGFAFVAESYAFGGGEAERAQYLTRDFGLHFTTDTARSWFARATVAENSFRRETYRSARVTLVRRLGDR